MSLRGFYGFSIIIPFWLTFAAVSSTPLLLFAGEPANAPAAWSLELETEGVHGIHEGDAESVAEMLALFNARQRAVEAAYRYFSKKELVGVYGKEKEEILDLAADNLPYRILHRGRVDAALHVKIRVAIRPTDFIEAEIENLRLAKEEAGLAFRETMDPDISFMSEPGHMLAKAHRLFRIRSPRAGIIYLDRLEEKYPHWAPLFESKALGYYLLHEPARMKDALQKACGLWSRKACEDLQMLKKVDDYSLE